jgi:hypothetical protein
MKGLFAAPPVRSVWRSVLIGGVWSLVLVLVSAALLGVVALIAGGIALVTSAPAVATMARTARSTAWIIGGVDIVVLVWVVAYASTGWGSRGSSVVGSIAGLGIAVGYVLLGSLGGPVAGLALGWSIVIPAEHPGRVAARALPALIAALFAPGVTSAGPGLLVATALLSAWVAAFFVSLGDAIWSAVVRRLEEH